MIGVAELLYDIDLKLNKIATNSHQSINVEDKILALNESQLILIKKKVTGTVAGSGLESSKNRYDELERFIVPHITISVAQDTAPGLAAYYSNIATLPQPYMYFMDVYFQCTKGPCKDRTVKGFRVRHADLQAILANNNTCPSFEYQELPVTITADRLYGYTDGTFSIDTCHLSYIRYPIKVDIEGYIDFDGNPSTTRDCELPNYLKDELIDITVQQLAMSTENTPAAQFAQVRIQQQP